MTLLYACQLVCYALIPLALLMGQGIITPLLVITAYLIRRQSILEQQVAHLLTKETVRETARAWVDQRAKQVPQVKGL